MELELEQTQQGSSHEVSVSTERVEELKKLTFRVIRFSTHSDEWKSFQSQHQTAMRYSIHTVKQSSRNQRTRRWRYNLTPAESKFKTAMLDHQDKHMMKAQVYVSKSFAISDVQALPQRKYY
nr:hypothetical protein [Tanacetum cinerariifolium]